MHHDMNALAIPDLVRDMVPVLRAVEFRFKGGLAPEAKKVCLASSFTHWDAGTHPMRKGPDGDWNIVVMLPPGIYPYLFCVDGVWWNDRADHGRAPSPWGRDYSLKAVA
ncbi:MAG TPA: hypothetical protein VFM39_03220 [bacterium]|nr:hypothetical protein [bacterium]